MLCSPRHTHLRGRNSPRTYRRPPCRRLHAVRIWCLPPTNAHVVSQANGLGQHRTGGRSLVAGNMGGRYFSGMDYRDIITMEPGKRSGKPCVRGMRIAVSDVLEYLAAGMSVEEILNDFPELTADDIRACLAFAADRERRLTAPMA